MSLNIKPITREIHDKFMDSFDCGNLRLNLFFNGSESLDTGIGKTYVFLSEDESVMLGYYNLTTGMINDVDNPRNRIGGAVHINCFALDNRYHGLLQDYDSNGNSIKLSDIFFRQCIETILSLRDRIGFTFITLSSTREGYSLYKRAMFEELDEDMFIAEKDMEQDGCIEMYYPLDIEG
jgi:hypothetical protein